MSYDKKGSEFVQDIDTKLWTNTLVPELVERQTFVDNFLRLQSLSLKGDCNFVYFNDLFGKHFGQQTVEYQLAVRWSQVNCAEVKLRPFSLKSDCPSFDGSHRRRNEFRPCRVYVKMHGSELRNFCDYVQLLQDGRISIADHMMLCTQLEQHRAQLEHTFRTHMVITSPNEDIPLLHFNLNILSQ